VDGRGFGQQLVDRAGGRAAEDVKIERGLRPPHEGQTHHRVAEVVEFDHEEARLHRENQRRLSR
jgi:hypothetical protein